MQGENKLKILKGPMSNTTTYKSITHQDIALEVETHTYRLASNPKMTFTSCTEFVESFFEPFDAQAVAERLVATNAKYRDYTVESLLAEWKQAADDGTRVHSEMEEGILTNKFPQTRKGKQGFEWLAANLSSKRYDLFPEVIVYSEQLGLAGTIDLLARDKTTGIYLLVDWKTNKRINRKPFGNKRGVKGPAVDLDDCHTVKYGLQLSLYHYILETEYGIDPTRQAIVHLSDWEVNPIRCPYVKDKVQELLEYSERL